MLQGAHSMVSGSAKLNGTKVVGLQRPACIPCIRLRTILALLESIGESPPSSAASRSFRVKEELKHDLSTGLDDRYGGGIAQMLGRRIPHL